MGSSAATPTLEMDANLELFEAEFIPLLKEAKARGLTFRVEHCPMPGWNITDKWHNNLAYAPGPGLRYIGSASGTVSVTSSVFTTTLARDPHGPGHPLGLSVSER